MPADPPGDEVRPDASQAAAQPAGPELARAVLDAARATRAERVERTPKRRAEPGGGRRLRGYSGAGPDPRDPQPFGALLAELVRSRGWQRPTAEARVFGMWPELVGADLARHCRPVKLIDGELTIEAESTAWATQIRLLARTLRTRICSEAGRDVVTRIHVHGPVAPSWTKGPKRVHGRGPRDTYG